jgi:hypothetical protein
MFKEFEKNMWSTLSAPSCKHPDTPITLSDARIVHYMTEVLEILRGTDDFIDRHDIPITIGDEETGQARLERRA